MKSRPARYDDVADFYEGFVSDSYDHPSVASLLELLPPVHGVGVLDLACGDGRLARELARRGASVVGLDLSAALLEKAASHERARPLGISYVHGDASDPAVLDGLEFDVVACLFALADIDDLESALATVSRVLRPGGAFAFSLLHPCFPGWGPTLSEPDWDPQKGYFAEGWWRPSGPSTGIRPRVGTNHRMLSTYVNALVSAGFDIDRLVEPTPEAKFLLSVPATGAAPLYLAARCVRRRTAQLGRRP